eukprot:3952038-Prorocentrum_lima.AAC.1
MAPVHKRLTLSSSLFRGAPGRLQPRAGGGLTSTVRSGVADAFSVPHGFGQQMTAWHGMAWQQLA